MIAKIIIIIMIMMMIIIKVIIIIIIITIDKKERKGIILDIAVPADVRVGEKEREKVEKTPGLEERDRKIVET